MEKSKKKVMLYAFVKSNLGDDLFIKIITERYPNISFNLIAPTVYKKTFEKNTNLKIYNLNFATRKLNALLGRLFNKRIISNLIAKQCDISVYIGGSLFIENTNKWKRIFRIDKCNLIKNQPFYLLGANFGPFQDKEFYISYKQLFQKYDDICFRESYSYNLFKDIKHVRYASDIVFTYKPPKNVDIKKQIAISVINLKRREALSRYHSIYIKQLIRICEDFVSKGYQIQLVSFCTDEGDVEAIDEIIKGIKDEYISSILQYLYEGNIESCISIIQQSEYILATRFHAMILGWVMQRPVFPILYSNKTLNVINDVSFQGKYIRVQDMDQLSMDDVYYNLEKQIVVNVDEQKVRAEEQFLYLDKQLKNEDQGSRDKLKS